jgi:hypothetical protein
VLARFEEDHAASDHVRDGAVDGAGGRWIGRDDLPLFDAHGRGG